MITVLLILAAFGRAKSKIFQNLVGIELGRLPLLYRMSNFLLLLLLSLSLLKE